MGAYYCDSSALVKRYANETGSLWVRSLTDPQAGNDIFIAHITGIEVVAAIARKTPYGRDFRRRRHDGYPHVQKPFHDTVSLIIP